MNNKAKIEMLQERVSRIEEQLQALRNAPVCPLCGSGITKSTLYPRMFCKQNFGYCGYLILPDLPCKRDPKPFFSRTSWRSDTGEMDIFKPMWTPFVEMYFIAGRQVSKEEYYQEHIWHADE